MILLIIFSFASVLIPLALLPNRSSRFQKVPLLTKILKRITLSIFWLNSAFKPYSRFCLPPILFNYFFYSALLILLVLSGDGCSTSSSNDNSFLFFLNIAESYLIWSRSLGSIDGLTLLRYFTSSYGYIDFMGNYEGVYFFGDFTSCELSSLISI